MTRQSIPALSSVLVVAACATTTTAPAPTSPPPSPIEQAAARLDSVPAVPDTAPLTGAALVERVSGGPYALTNYTLNVAAVSNWDLEEGRAFGTFRNIATGEGGDWSLPASVENDKLCTEQAAGTVCQTIYAWRDGFMEVTDEGMVHAITLPVE